MITMFQFPTAYGQDFSVSPYCAKLELYFRLTNRKYETKNGNVLKSPNKLVPYVRWEDGALEAESDAIIDKLESLGPTLDEGLSQEAKARGEQLTAIAQDAIYYSCLFHRFADDDTWRYQRETVRELVPWVLSPVLTRVIRRDQVRKCEDAGFQDPSDYQKGLAAVQALSDALAGHDFILDDKPRTADCAVWGNLANCASTATPSPVRNAIREDAGLTTYIRRLSEMSGLKVPF
jgi:glutathione S-transferase